MKDAPGDGGQPSARRKSKSTTSKSKSPPGPPGPTPQRRQPRGAARPSRALAPSRFQKLPPEPNVPRGASTRWAGNEGFASLDVDGEFDGAADDADLDEGLVPGGGVGGGDEYDVVQWDEDEEAGGDDEDDGSVFEASSRDSGGGGDATVAGRDAWGDDNDDNDDDDDYCGGDGAYGHHFSPFKSIGSPVAGLSSVRAALGIGGAKQRQQQHARQKQKQQLQQQQLEAFVGEPLQKDLEED